MGFAGGIYNFFKKQKSSTIKDEPVAEEILFVQTSQFPTESINSSIQIDGRVNAFEKLTLSAEANGKLQSIGKTWRTGSYFRKGDLLFKVGSNDETLNLYAQRSSLLNAITQIMPDLKFDHPEAFEKWKRYLDDFNIEATTNTLPAITNQKEKYYIAGKNIYNLYYGIKSAEAKLTNFNVYAPFNGVFTSVNAYPGTLVSPGVQLAAIMNTDHYELQTPISPENLSLVSIGQKVSLTERGQGKVFNGKISRIGQQIDQTTQSIPVFIAVTGKGLRDGMYLSGKLNGNKIDNVISIPLSSIVNENQVYYLKDSLIHEKSVEMILRMDNQAIVRGISPDEFIITKGLNSLSPGQKAVSIKK